MAVDGVITSSPASFPLADLDVTLRALLQRELRTAGVGPVELTFESPARDSSARWPSPALNLFLYDVRESDRPRDRSFFRDESSGRPTMRRAPVHFDCAYAITAWAGSALDEHRLLSQVLTTLLAVPELPGDLLAPSLRIGSPPVPLPTRIGTGRDQSRTDIWNALGAPYKVSLEYVVTTFILPAVRRERGPLTGGVIVSLDETAQNTQGGTVVDRAGEPVAGAWVLARGLPLSTTSGEDGRFLLSGLAAGEHELEIAAPMGETGSVTVTVPGPPIRVEVAP